MSRWHKGYNNNLAIKELSDMCRARIAETERIDNAHTDNDKRTETNSNRSLFVNQHNNYNNENTYNSSNDNEYERKRSIENTDFTIADHDSNNNEILHKKRQIDKSNLNENENARTTISINDYKNETNVNNNKDNNSSKTDETHHKDVVNNNERKHSLVELIEVHSDQMNLDSYDYSNYDCERIQEEWRKKIGTKLFNLLNDLINIDQRTFPKGICIR